MIYNKYTSGIFYTFSSIFIAAMVVVNVPLTSYAAYTIPEWNQTKTNNWRVKNNVPFTGSKYNESCVESSLSASTSTSTMADFPTSPEASTYLTVSLPTIKDQAALAQAIDDWILAVQKNVVSGNPGDPRFSSTSPFVGIGKDAVESGVRNGVNPVLPIVMSRMETQMGMETTASGIAVGSHNAFGRMASSTQPSAPSGGNNFYKWTTWKASINDTGGDDMYEYLKRRFGTSGSISNLMVQYAPPFENDTDQYIKNIETWGNQIYTRAASATGAQPTTPTEPVVGDVDKIDTGATTPVETVPVLSACCVPAGGAIQLSATTPSGTTAVATEQNGIDAYNFMLEKGLTPNQALAILGNLMQESANDQTLAIDPNAKNPGNGAWGIAQWLGDRKERLLTLSNSSSLQTQLDYMWAELTGDTSIAMYSYYKDKVLDKMLATTSLYEQSKVVTSVYEQPCENDDAACFEREIGIRYNHSLKAAAKLGVTPDSTQANTPSSPINLNVSALSSSNCINTAVAFASGNFRQMVESYVFPDFHKNPWNPEGNTYPERIMPAFRSAADRYSTAAGNPNNIHIGGSRYPTYGDCVGFVSILVADSIDPYFNSYDRGGGATPGGSSGSPSNNIVNYLETPSNNWYLVGTGDSLSVDQLLPGDVGTISHHAYIFIGAIPGYESRFAEAALSSRGDRTPMSTNSSAQLNAYGETTQWWRYKGTSEKAM